MKKILFGFILFTSASAFASPNLECRLTSNEANVVLESSFRFSQQDSEMFGRSQLKDFIVFITPSKNKSDLLDVRVLITDNEISIKQVISFSAVIPNVSEGEVVLGSYLDRSTNTDLFIRCNQL